MSLSHDLPTKNATPSFTQLPIHWYTNPSVYKAEQLFLFAHAPKYAGHALMAPNTGDYYALNWMGNAKALVNQAGEVALLSNTCSHRQAILLVGQGNTEHIVCQLHRWTYTLDGTLLGAPQFEVNPC